MGAGKSQHSAGWYAGALVFWLLSAWLITVGLSSIIPQIFWPAGEVRGQASSCADSLRQLRRELLDHASQTFARAASYDAERDLAWFEAWDQRLARARPSCPSSDALTELNRLRHGLASLVERFEREQAPRIERLDELLGAEARLPQRGKAAGEQARTAQGTAQPGEQARAKPPQGEHEQPRGELYER